MSFDAIAPWYRTLETLAFGNALQRARVACLDEIGSPRHALIIGEGNGRFLDALLRAHPALEADCVDASGRMLKLARKRIHEEFPDRVDCVHFLQRDIKLWTPAMAHYDLIVTHFFLDCFPEEQVGEIVEKLSRAATADANWLVADFSIPGHGSARVRARAWLAAMYEFFRLVARIEAKELINPSPFLAASGFVLDREILLRRGMLKSQRWRKR